MSTGEFNVGSATETGISSRVVGHLARMQTVHYVLKMDQACVPRVAQSSTLGERKSGRLKTTWSQTIMAELSEVELERRHNTLRKKWREIVGTLPHQLQYVSDTKLTSRRLVPRIGRTP